METKKRDYVSEKDYILYLSKGSGEPDGFIVEDKGVKNNEPFRDLILTDKIAFATRMTSVQANRIAVEYHSRTNRYPFKLKISNYKNLIF